MSLAAGTSELKAEARVRQASGNKYCASFNSAPCVAILGELAIVGKPVDDLTDPPTRKAGREKLSIRFQRTKSPLSPQN